MTRISYIVATRNKLPYLRVLLDRLVELIAEDEEIVVVDGASTDGTVEYVVALAAAGKVRQFVSEPDHCQAHGYNKGILRAEGAFLKLLTDDDVYHLPSLRRCAGYLESHPEVDVLCGNIIDVRLRDGRIVYHDRPAEEAFHRWKDKGGPAFWFGDQGLLMRRSSLPAIGLMDNGVWCIDVELSVRLTSLRQVRLAWYSGVVACSVINAASLSLSGYAQTGNDREVQRVFDYYKNVARQRRLMREPSPVEPAVKSSTFPMREFLRPRTRVRALAARWKKQRKRRRNLRQEQVVAPEPVRPVEDSRIPEKARNLEDWMEARNRDKPGVFYAGSNGRSEK